ncbi:MAG TPA: hypothetical protein PK887_05475 [Ignavibacteriales bacterium]|jgi:hypothetical protein|nr:hypothetical protein [Ignavibacteriales bacterium]
MFNKNTVYSIIVAAWISAISQNIPFIKNFSYFLIIPNIPIITLYFYIKSNKIKERIKYNKILSLSILTGFISAIFSNFFDVIITYFTKNNDLVTTLPEIEYVFNQIPSVNQTYIKEALNFLYAISNEITTYGFSLNYVFLSLFNFLLINLLFSFLGSFFSMYYINNIILPNILNNED